MEGGGGWWRVVEGWWRVVEGGGVFCFLVGTREGGDHLPPPTTDRQFLDVSKASANFLRFTVSQSFRVRDLQCPLAATASPASPISPVSPSKKSSSCQVL